MTTWPMARPMMNAERVSWSVDGVLWKSAVIDGNAGRYMSIDSDPNAERPPSTSAYRSLLWALT